MRVTLEHRSSHAYPLAETAVAGLVQQLALEGEWVSASAQGEITFRHPDAEIDTPTLRVRFGVVDGFCELRLDRAAPTAKDLAPVFAAGPVEDLLTAAGFRRLSRSVTLRQVYQFGGAEVALFHMDGVGWFCEINAKADAADLDRLERRLGLSATSIRAFAPRVETI